MMTISDSTIDIPTASSSNRADVMSKNSGVILLRVPFSGMTLTLVLKVYIGTSMMLPGNVVMMYYKVSEWSKPVGTSISP